GSRARGTAGQDLGARAVRTARPDPDAPVRARLARLRPVGRAGMSPAGSIPFDRAAEVYDETRRLTPEASAATTELLKAELGDRGPSLEIGVGTGLIALPLAAAGVRLVGLDLSGPMLAKLVGKAGGRQAFPVVIGDATRLPFEDAVFGGAYLRHVLHL